MEYHARTHIASQRSHLALVCICVFLERFIESGFPHMRSLNIATGIRAGKILSGITDELMHAMARGCARLRQLSFIVDKSLPQRTIERYDYDSAVASL